MYYEYKIYRKCYQDTDVDIWTSEIFQKYKEEKKNQ